MGYGTDVRAFVGTSGWQYDSWRGPFYPEDAPKRAWLGLYTKRFATVEVNNTFYRLPGDATFEKWRAESPDGFVFVVKASRYITHLRRMRDPKESVDLLWSRARHLGDRLGPVLFQFPPKFAADAERLEAFLDVLPRGMRPAFEFRDASWSRDDRVLAALDAAGAAWVLVDRAGQIGPELVCGGWSYVRFHQGGPVRPGYARAALERWADRIAALGVEEVWAFFNNDPQAAAPRDAQVLSKLLRERGLEVPAPPEERAGDPTG
jgi:uncharacterized protein YecE (DUF72 family)